MSMSPMPSPRGTNKARLYVLKDLGIRVALACTRFRPVNLWATCLIQGFECEIASKNIGDDAGLGLIADKLAIFHIIPERRHAAHPQAFFLRCGDLVADPFTDHLPLELGER